MHGILNQFITLHHTIYFLVHWIIYYCTTLHNTAACSTQYYTCDTAYYSVYYIAHYSVYYTTSITLHTIQYIILHTTQYITPHPLLYILFSILYCTLLSILHHIHYSTYYSVKHTATTVSSLSLSIHFDINLQLLAKGKSCCRPQLVNEAPENQKEALKLVLRTVHK